MQPTPGSFWDCAKWNATQMCLGIWHCISLIFRVITLPFRGLIRLLYVVNGLGEPLPTKDSESGTAEAVAILGWVLVQSFALIFAERGQGPLPPWSWFFVVYLGTIVIVMGSVVGLLVSTKLDSSGKVCRTYNKGTLVYCRYVLWLSPILMCSFLSMGVKGVLPGQRPIDDVSLKMTKLDTHTFKDNAEGFEVHFELSSRDYGKPLPETLFVTVLISEEIAGPWKLASVYAYWGEPARQNLLEIQPALDDDSVRPNIELSVEFPLSRLRPDATHTVVLNVAPKDGGKDKDRVKSAIELVKEKRAVEAIIRKPKE